MRRYIFIFILILCSTFASAQEEVSPQERFSLRYNFDYPAAVLTNVIATDSLYYVMGIIRDTIFPNNEGTIFLKADLNGEIAFAQTMTDTLKDIRTWFSSMQLNVYGNIVVAGEVRDSTTKAWFLEMTLDGDTLFTKEILHPSYPDVIGLVNRDMAVTENGYLILNVIKNPDSNYNDTQIDVIKLNLVGDIISRKTYGHQAWDNEPYKIIPFSDGYIIAGVNR